MAYRGSGRKARKDLAGQSKISEKKRPWRFGAGLWVGLSFMTFQGCEKAKTGPDGQAMLENLRALVDLGLRSPGTKEAAKARNYLEENLKSSGLNVRLESFLAATPRGPVAMTNVIGRIPGSAADVLVLGTHWDTKTGIEKGFQGANDGGSGTVVLLEVARLAAAQEWPFSVEFVFFDGEEAFVKFSQTDGLYGSREYVRKHKFEGDLDKIKAVFIVDMVGDRKLAFWNDTNSDPGLGKAIRSSAEELNLKNLFRPKPESILDDHFPFLDAGLPAALLLDFEYGPQNKYWHTKEDTMKQISKKSLVSTARLVLGTLDVLARDGFPE